MNRHLLVVFVFVQLVGALFLWGGQFAIPMADARDFIIHVGPGGKDTPLALPMPAAGADTSAEARQMWAVVRRDLEMSGYFTIIDPDAYIEQNKGVEPGTFDFADWRVLRAAALAKTRVLAQGEGIRADVFIYDVNAGLKLDARGIAGSRDQVRYVGHRVADAILMALTGERGLFGSRFAVVGARGKAKEVFVMDIDGLGVTNVTNNGSINLSPAWSPAGDKLAFTSYKRGNADLYVKELRSGRVKAISARPGTDSGASYSSDGARIALARSEAGDTDVFVIDAETGADITRVTRGGGIDVAPDFSPNGAEIAFSSERSGGAQIYVQEFASGAARRASFDVGSFNTDPVFSPDGQKIAFVTRDRHFDIIVADADGRNAQRITQDMGDNEDPSWSPDGRYLAFSSTRNGRSEIWLSTADGRHQARVTETSGGWTQPAWAP